MVTKVCIEVKVRAAGDAEHSRLFVGKNTSDVLKLIRQNEIKLFDYQIESLKSGYQLLQTSIGKIGVLIAQEGLKTKSNQPGSFSHNQYSFFRETVGAWLKDIEFKSFELVAPLSFNTHCLWGVGVGSALATYSYKTQRGLSIYAAKPHAKVLTEALESANAVNLARQLVDCPAGDLTPTKYKDLILKSFVKEKNFSVKVLGPKDLKRQGYGLITGVGQGAEEGPYLVHVSYKARGAKKSIAGVGKGITFDTGGLDMKPSQFMRWMKKDMGGSATLFGLASWFKTAKPKVNADFVFAIAENAVSKEAFRPGDVLKAQNGVSVEVHNTDAEGRLALGSGLNYLSSLNKKFDVCFDVATLTGAIKYGLGDRVGGLFSNDQKLGQSLQKISEFSADPLWLMPIPNWTRGALKTSHVADYVNCKDGYGGAISAAEFLNIFVPKDTPWFHLDLYTWTDAPRGAFLTKGATGQGVQVLQDWVRDL